MTQTLERPRVGKGDTGFEDVEHIVYPDDHTKALCGADIPEDEPWNIGLPVCEACRAVQEGRMN